VSFLVLTDGSKGSWDPSRNKDELVRVRIEEQHAAEDAVEKHGTLVHAADCQPQWGTADPQEAPD